MQSRYINNNRDMATLSETQKSHVDELQSRMLKARCNQDWATYYACKGEIETIYANATGDYSVLTGKGANRNRFY